MGLLIILHQFYILVYYKQIYPVKLIISEFINIEEDFG